MPRMAACGHLLADDMFAMKGRWAEAAGSRPVHLEIGCGKGGFVTEMASLNPDVFFVAVERVESVLVLALEKAKRMMPDNVMFISADAALLGEVFAPGEVKRVYLNFSDPWPQKKYWKRRLTHERMMEVYDSFLPSGGDIVLKTDNIGLAEFSVCSFSQFGYILHDVSFDLHSCGEVPVTTEYERQFMAAGMKIYRMRAVKPQNKLRYQLENRDNNE